MTALLLGGAPDAGATSLTRRSLAGGAALAAPAAKAVATNAAAVGANARGTLEGPDRLDAPGNLGARDVDPQLSSPAAPLAAYDERWLQALLFAHPELVLLDQMEPGAGSFVPLCRELAIPRPGGSVFPDLLGVTRTGRLVLVECKLWRNPQARREVVAQILEYASLLRRWSFGDLTAQLKQRHEFTGENPIFAHARQRWPELDEAAFTDGVARSLARGDFHLVIAGDGIRADLEALAAHLGAHGSGLSRLALLELQLWSDAAGRTLVVPSVPFRTEVVTQRVLVAPDGLPVAVEEVAPSAAAASATDEVGRPGDPEMLGRRADNRSFWQQFIDAARFDHPDQAPPRHGRDNWVRLDLPKPWGWITVFRLGNPVRELGVFWRLRGDDKRQTYADLVASQTSLAAESGLPIELVVEGEAPFQGRIGVFRTDGLPGTDVEQLRWLSDACNRFVSLVRLQLAQEADTAR